MAWGYRIRSGDWNYGGSKFKLSRSKVDLFLKCPRCFYLDNRLGIKRPETPPFNLNKAIDTLLKKEFDVCRAHNEAHPLMDTYGIDAKPFAHKDLDDWRENFVGVQHFHKPIGLIVSGAVDDVWANSKGELIVVDYKATSKDETVTLDEEWKIQYKRQLEFYQWLLRQKGFKVSDTGYFVYANGKTGADSFDGRLEFDVQLIPYVGSDDWVEGTLAGAKKCLSAEHVPPVNPNCDYCSYIGYAAEHLPKKKAPAKKAAKKPSVEDVQEHLF